VGIETPFKNRVYILCLDSESRSQAPYFGDESA